MKVEKLINQSSTGTKLEKIVKSLKNGEGLTKEELSKMFNFQSSRVIEKWIKRYPILEKHRVYVPVNDGKHRVAVFVNLKYKESLLKNGKATESY